MNDEINKTLLIASLEASREPALQILTALKEAGYGVDFCRINLEDEKDQSDIKPDIYLTKHMDLEIYKGIVFLDDGGDPSASKILAKRANEMELAVGGYGLGCEILNDAKLLKGKFISSTLPEEISKGAKIVNSPAVRSDNIVTTGGNCAVGFTFLFIDALGGEKTRTVESNDVRPLARSAVIISKLSDWPSHWKVAEDLSKKGATLFIADWDDIDFSTKKINRSLAIGPHIDSNVALMKFQFNLPQKVWVKNPSIKEADLNKAKIMLKTAGCYPSDDEVSPEDEYLKNLKREMSHRGIFPQRDGKIAIHHNEDTVKMSPREAYARFRSDFKYYLEKFKESEHRTKRMYARLCCKTVLKLRLIYDWMKFKNIIIAMSEKEIKTADYIFNRGNDYNYEGTVPGPYSNVNVPTRVIPWYDKSDWLNDITGIIDEDTIAQLSRYNPESKDGFFAEFDLWHSNDPLSWDQVEKGEGNYPSRVQLMH